MDPAQFRRLIDLVGDALQRAPADRPAFLAERCGGDRQLLDEATALLAESDVTSADTLTAHLEERVRRAAALELPPDAAPARLGQRVGAYRLVGEVGRGGMGTVYLAERADDQYRARVAIKFMHSAFNAPALEHRFRAERQILADLNHANIARLLDGGTAADGTPYLVMEYVDGEAIDAWCASRDLDVRRRIELFLPVCDAVAHAHRSGVIHRDLKPSNILVTRDGVPKLVDFGIAKLIGADGASEATGTLRVMTPRYASPEQVLGAKLSAATDVYSLGVVLYELLAGAPPYDLADASAGRIERLVCHVRPQPPSAAAADRPAAWRRHLLGPLDDIVLRALHKDPARRHASVLELTEQLKRRLDAPPPGRVAALGYRLRRQARRPGVVAAGAIVLLGLGGGLVVRDRLAVRVPPLGPFEFIALPEAASPVPSPYRVHTGDFNGDGLLDLLWNHLGQSANLTRVALGAGDGSFAFQQVAANPDHPARPWNDGYELVTGDFTGDGRTGLAWYGVVDRSSHLHVALPTAQATFRHVGPHVESPRWAGRWRALVADADQDGRDDLIFTVLAYDNLTRVLLSQGDGVFRETWGQAHITQNWDRYRTYLGDVDGDGRTDLIWNDVPGGMNRTYVARSLQAMEMLPWQDHPLAVPEYLEPERSRWAGFRTHVGDVNGDGRADILWVATGPDSVTIDRAMGQATGQFRFLGAQRVPRPPGSGPLATSTGDFNGDRRTDLLLYDAGGTGGRFWIALGTRRGALVPTVDAGPVPGAASGGGPDLLVADFNGDGRSDLVWYGIGGAVMAQARPPDRNGRAP